MWDYITISILYFTTHNSINFRLIIAMKAWDQDIYSLKMLSLKNHSEFNTKNRTVRLILFERGNFVMGLDPIKKSQDTIYYS